MCSSSTPNGVLRAMIYHPLTTGRNTDEILAPGGRVAGQRREQGRDTGKPGGPATGSSCRYRRRTRRPAESSPKPSSSSTGYPCRGQIWYPHGTLGRQRGEHGVEAACRFVGDGFELGPVGEGDHDLWVEDLDGCAVIGGADDDVAWQ